MAARPDAASARSPEADGLWTLLQVDQQRITALDTVSVAIRGWVATLDSALASFAFTKANPGLIAVAIAATVLFLPLDLQYRRIQLLHAERSDQIEQQVAPEYRFRSVFRSNPGCWSEAAWADTPPWQCSTRPYWHF